MGYSSGNLSRLLQDQATGGLFSTPGSIAHVTAKIEADLHANERVMGKAFVPVGETHAADRMTLRPGPFVLQAAADDWGAWVLILGSTDLPINPGWKFFDFHKISVKNVSLPDTYFLQLVWGPDPTIAFANGDFNEFDFVPNAVQPGGRPAPIPIRSPNLAIGVKIWARISVFGVQAGTMDLYYALHEYPG